MKKNRGKNLGWGLVVALVIASKSFGQGTITLDYPVGGEFWMVDSTYTIQWTSTPTAASGINIDYSLDIINWNPLAANVPDTGEYELKIPQLSELPYKSVLIRVSDAADPSINANSKAFSIVDTLPVLSLTSPKADTVMHMGDLAIVRWDQVKSGDWVKIQYTIDAGNNWEELVFNTENDGAYNWPVPSQKADSCKIAIIETDGWVTDTSGWFKIVQPEIQFTFPTSADTLCIDSTYDIQWASFGNAGLIYMEVTKDNATWDTLFSDLDDDGSESFVVPDTLECDSCRLRAWGTQNDGFGISEYFAIQPNQSPQEKTITVTSPNNGETISSGNSYTITWSNTGSIDSISIYYKNAGADWTPIVAKTANKNSYQWTVPDIVCSSCFIGVQDANNATTIDSSDVPFAIDLGTKATAKSKKPESFSANVLQTRGNNTMKAMIGLPHKSDVTLSLISLHGRTRAHTTYENVNSGYHLLDIINNRQKVITPGMYIANIEAGKYVTTRVITLFD
ncbi:MAG: hypothetical protein GF398_01750 [Chitinivibrionales bacterium]|nr:hypothetical protein [Chitinivibrionales bacterium]